MTLHLQRAALMQRAGAQAPAGPDYGIYTTLGAAHLWSATQYAGGTWTALIGGVNLISGTTPVVPDANVVTQPTLNNQKALVCPNANSGFYANIGPIGADHSVIWCGISVQNTGNQYADSYYYGISSTGPGDASPRATGMFRGSANSSDRVATVYMEGLWPRVGGPSYGNFPAPVVAIGTATPTLLSIRCNMLTKYTLAISGSYASAAYLHVHGIAEPGASGRLCGDSIAEIAIFRRVLSDADAVTLMNDRCAVFGITPTSWQDVFSLAGLPAEQLEVAAEFLSIALLLLANPLSDAREQALYELLEARTAALAIIPSP